MSGAEPFARLSWTSRDRKPIKPAPLEPVAAVPAKSAEVSQNNLLIEGENLAVMESLMPDYEGRIDLIYLDPPFLTGNAYKARIGADEDSRRPDEWDTVRGYSDDWPSGADYLDMLYARLKLMHRLLAENGTIYLHLDWHASAYARVLMDEIFGPQRLLNEIVWVYHGPSPIRSAFNRKHDTILSYTKSDTYTFNVDDVRVPYADSTVKTFKSSSKAGFGKKPNLKRGKVPEDWWYFPVVARLHSERTGYPTQKPEALMERIILASSNEGDLVADFFCGAGTTMAVAQTHNRHWLGCDHTQLAIATSYRRLLLEGHDGFELWRDQRLGQANNLEIMCSWEPEAKRILLTDVSGSRAPQEFPANVACWEVDPGFNGELFQSKFQCARAFQDEQLSLQLELPADCKTPNIAVRVTDQTGDTSIIQLNE